MAESQTTTELTKKSITREKEARVFDWIVLMSRFCADVQMSPGPG